MAFDKELKEVLARYAKDRARQTRLGKVANALAKIKAMKGRRPSLTAAEQADADAAAASSSSFNQTRGPQRPASKKLNLGLDRTLNAALNIKSLRANVHLAMIKQQGATIKQLAHDLANNVVVDTRKTHQVLRIA